MGAGYVLCPLCNVVTPNLFPPSSYGTAKASVGITQTAVLRPDLIVRNCISVVMAGIIGIFGLVVSVLITDHGKYLVDHRQ